MLSKKEHDQWFDGVRDILRDCRITVNNWKRIGTPNGTHDIEFQNHAFTRHLVHHYWFTLITQLNKLFIAHKDNQTSFQAIMNKYMAEPLDPYYKKRLADNLPDRQFWYGMHKWGTVDEMKAGVKKHRARFEGRTAPKDVKAAIKKVQNWRNKATAHRDLDAPELDAPTFAELEMLTKLADDIYAVIRAGFGYPHEDTLVVGFDANLVMRMWQDGHLFHKLERFMVMEHHIDLRKFIDKLPD